MIKNLCSTLLIMCGLSVIYGVANAAESTVPEPFQRFDDTSTYSINYEDLTALLKTLVVDVGRSTREIANPTRAKTGTRMKVSVKRSTVKEANRFHFEAMERNKEGQQLLAKVQRSLEQLPGEVSLAYFSRDEQLAYWLNLYNTTLLNEIVKIYPKKNLKKFMSGKNSILSKKILTVAGIPLSLNDIQYTILKQNYNNDPVIIYGLYQGVIGGPNIRKTAYTGSNVHRSLKNNAIEFINSNRGTYSKDEKTFRVSSLYARNKSFFKNLESDLSEHLLTYLQGDERRELQSASNIKADIDDWAVTDLQGPYREIGAGLADNNAALLDAIKSTSPADGGGVMGATVGHAGSTMVARSTVINLIDPALLEHLHQINEKRMITNEQNATVTLEEMGEVSTEPEKDENN